MIKPAEMTTLSQVIEKLRLKRQDNEFILTPEGFYHWQRKILSATGSKNHQNLSFRRRIRSF